MNKYQKAAALSLRLVSSIYFLLTLLSIVSIRFAIPPEALWIMITPSIGSAVVFICAKTLARLVAFGIDD
jgi:hypothetical protein